MSGTPSAKSRCTETGCDNLSLARGLCSMHYNSARRAGKLAGIEQLCQEVGCGSAVLAKGVCGNHYSVAQRNGVVGRPCVESGCGRSVTSHDRCGRHFSVAARAGVYGIRCLVSGCDGYSLTVSKQGLCGSCHGRTRRYGLSAEQLARLIAGVACELCKTSNADHVDHNHKTGAVRGFLCGPCNMSLGAFNDDAAKLRAAADYLERSVTRDAA